jgi:hypothetical protein
MGRRQVQLLELEMLLAAGVLHQGLLAVGAPLGLEGLLELEELLELKRLLLQGLPTLEGLPGLEAFWG